MARLTFWCDEETNEASASDSPYFLVYVGNAQQQTSVVRRVRRQSWDDNVDAGEPARTANVAFPEVISFDLVLIALLEEDFDPDSGLVGNVQDWMNNLDGLLQPTIVGTSDVINIFKQEFNKALTSFSPTMTSWVYAVLRRPRLDTSGAAEDITELDSKFDQTSDQEE